MIVAVCPLVCDMRRPPPGAFLRRNRVGGAEAIGARRSRDPVRIALLLPLSGPAGMWGPSCRTSAVLAQREINASGGLLGREVELVFQDAGGDPENETVAPPLTTYLPPASSIAFMAGGKNSALYLSGSFTEISAMT